MQPNPFPFVSSVFSQILSNGGLSEGIDSPRVPFFLSILFSQEADMDLAKVGEKILSSARSFSLLPSTSDRPEVPARAAAAAAVARALAGLPPHQRFSLPSSSEELSSIYGSRPHDQVVEELEEDFYSEDFDPVRHVLDHIPSDEDELTYFEGQATLRLAQLDRIAERLSRHVMEHHEEMVKGMHLVRELERDLKIANVICMNGRRHLTSSMQEVSRDLVVTSDSKRKQALLDLLPILNELRHAGDLQLSLESHVDEGNYSKAFQVLSEYLQLLDSFSELSVIQEMSRDVEVWLGKTLQKLDALLLGVCQEFKKDSYITVVDAYALIGDVTGLAEKIQSFFMQEVLTETHTVLKNVVQEDSGMEIQQNRLTYSDLCLRIPEPKFRLCLLRTLASLFRLLSSYYGIMDFQVENKVSVDQSSGIKIEVSDLSSGEVDTAMVAKVSSGVSESIDSSASETVGRQSGSSHAEESITSSTPDDCPDHIEARNSGGEASSSGSPWYFLRKDATEFVSQTLHRGRKNLWQLTTSRVSVLLSSAAVSSTSIHQFLRIYDDLNIFILAGEAFCGVEASEFRQKLRVVCENYVAAFHRQNIYALKMVLEKETWLKMPPDMIQVISFAGLVGDGAPLIVSSINNAVNGRVPQTSRPARSNETGSKRSGFSHWINGGNPFLLRLTCNSKDSTSPRNGFTVSGEPDGNCTEVSASERDRNHANGTSPASEEENEDLLADFIDEDSQLPSRISKTNLSKNQFSHCNDEEVASQTGSSLCLLRLMDKYARLMQKFEIVTTEFFKGICQLFEVFFYFIYETFGYHNAHSGSKGLAGTLNNRLKAALSRIAQDSDQWIKPQLIPSSPTSLNSSLQHMDVTPTSPTSTRYSHFSGTSFGLKERCAGADTLSLVTQILLRSKHHLQSMLLQNNASIVEDFYVHLVDAVPDLIEHIHKTTARLLLHMNGYVDRIANAKWEVKELGLEHNGYVDLLLGEFKHYKTRLVHGGVRQKVQDHLLDCGLEIVAETLVEGLSRVKRCTDEGRALMSLDLQVLINGLQHFVPTSVRPKLQVVETFIKAYYLPETEYVYWAQNHPEYSKNQITGLVNLVATMKGWKRKVRLEILEKIE